MGSTELEYGAVGSGEFPVDMLRYDRCWPAEEAGSYELARDAAAPRRMVLLHSHQQPTEARWLSFGWRVVGVAVGGVAAPGEREKLAGLPGPHSDR